MTGSRMCRGLLSLYPPEWRARYGQELEELVVEARGDRRTPVRTWIDIASTGGRERLRATGLSGDGDTGDGVRAGALLVLCAWALTVIAAAGVEKSSEHWQDVLPRGARILAPAAFDTLWVAGIGAAVLVTAGLAVALPHVATFLRGGGWASIRRPSAVATLLTGLATAATVGLALVAHELSPEQRAGHDALYSAAFLGWAALVVAALLASTAVAVTVGRRLRLPPRALRVETWLACATAALIAIMTIATAFWGAVLDGDRAVGVAPLVAAGTLMLLATTLASAGARRAARGLRALPLGS